MRFLLVTLALSACSVIGKPVDHALNRRHLEVRSDAPPLVDSSSASSTSLTTSSSSVPPILSSATASITSSTSTNSAVTIPAVPSVDTSLQLATPATAASSPATASVTLFQNELNAFVPTAATVPPTSSCAVLSAPSSVLPGGPVTVTIPASMYCQCGTASSYVETSTSVNNRGTAYIYCNTAALGTTSTWVSGKASATAISTILPSAVPGTADNPNWANVSCDLEPFKIAYEDPELQWNISGAAAAWTAVTNAWASNSDPTPGFVNFLSDFFRGPIDLNCDILGFQYCVEFHQCGQWSTPNAPGTSPAAYMILNSMTYLHSVLNNFYTSVEEAQSLVSAQVGQFTTQFSVIEKEIVATIAKQEAERRKYERLLLILDLVIQPLFGFVLRLPSGTSGGPAGNFLSALGSVITSEITNVINYVELSFQNMNIVYTQNTFSEYSTIITNSWLNSTQNISSAIFDQPETLYGFINNGAFFLDGPPPASQFNVSEALTQAFFANILAEAWDGGAKYGSPFVLTAEGIPNPSCDYDIFSDLPNLSDLDLTQKSRPSNFTAETCFTYNEGTYWLVTLATTNISALSHGDLPEYQFEVPFGISGLNGTGTVFGGLDITTVQANIINTWFNRSFVNDFTQAIPPATVQDITSLDGADLSNAFGLVPIPVCSVWSMLNETYYNPTNENGDPWWPCTMDTAQATSFDPPDANDNECLTDPVSCANAPP